MRKAINEEKVNILWEDWKTTFIQLNNCGYCHNCNLCKHLEKITNYIANEVLKYPLILV